MLLYYVMTNELFLYFPNCFLLRSTLNGKNRKFGIVNLCKLIRQVVFSSLNACYSRFLLMVM